MRRGGGCCSRSGGGGWRCGRDRRCAGNGVGQLVYGDVSAAPLVPFLVFAMCPVSFNGEDTYRGVLVNTVAALGIVQARAVIGVCTAGEKILHIVGGLPRNIAVGIDALFAGVAAIELLVTGKLHLIPDGAVGFCLTDDCNAGIDREYAQLLVYLVPGPERVAICWLRRARVPARPISGSSITKSIKRATIRFFKVITPHFIRQSPQRDIRGTGHDALLQSLWWHIWSMWDGSHRRCRYAWTAGRHKS